MFSHLDDPEPFVPDDGLRARVERTVRQRRGRRRLGAVAGVLAALTVVGGTAIVTRSRRSAPVATTPPTTASLWLLPPSGDRVVDVADIDHGSMKYFLTFSVEPGTQYQVSVQGPAASDPGTTQALNEFRSYLPGGTVVIETPGRGEVKEVPGLGRTTLECAGVHVDPNVDLAEGSRTTASATPLRSTSYTGGAMLSWFRDGWFVSLRELGGHTSEPCSLSDARFVAAVDVATHLREVSESEWRQSLSSQGFLQTSTTRDQSATTSARPG